MLWMMRWSSARAARQRKPLGQKKRGAAHVDVRDQRVEGVHETLHHGFIHAGREDRPQQSAHRDAGHLAPHLEHAACSPARQALFGDFGDDRSDCLQPLRRERRRHQPPLSHPGLAMIHHQAVADQDVGTREKRPFGVVFVVVEHDVLQVIGMVDEPDRRRPEPERRHVVGGRPHQLDRECRWVGEQAGQHAEQRPVTRCTARC
jgi:hypothetical protein